MDIPLFDSADDRERFSARVANVLVSLNGIGIGTCAGEDARCENCLYRRRGRSASAGHYECRRLPPVAPGRDGGPAWPTVEPDDWCASWQSS